MPSKISKKNNNKKGKKSKKYSRKTNKKYNNRKSRKLQRGGSNIPSNEQEIITPSQFAYTLSKANSGLADAQFSIGFFYLIGRGTEKNEEEGLRYLKMASDQGDINATLLLGKQYYNKRNYSEAFKFIEQPADDGNAEAQYVIGMMYKEGQLGNENEEEGLKYLKLAADQGYTKAQMYLGDYYYEIKNYIESFKLYKKAADNDNTEAQFNIGNMYLNGEGTNENYKEAFPYFKKAADKEHPDSQFIIGMMYYKGDGTAQNEVEALKYLEKAAIKGISHAQYEVGYIYHLKKNYVKSFKYLNLVINNESKLDPTTEGNAYNILGNMCYYGRGTPQSFSEAFKYYTNARLKGNLDAECNLGMMYYDGKGTKKDISKALDHLKSAASKGHKLSQENINSIYFNGMFSDDKEINREEAFKYIEIIANKNNNFFEKFLLGMMYHKGYGVSQDKNKGLDYLNTASKGGNEKATYFLDSLAKKNTNQKPNNTFDNIKKAADNGDIISQYNVATMYYQGNGTLINKEEALKYFKKAADKGDSDAQFELGMMYYQAIGTPINKEEALKYFKMAAEQGNVLSQSSIGVIYTNEKKDKDRVNITPEEAFKYTKMAVEQGNVEAQGILGFMYIDGDGVEKNINEGVKYLQIAANEGDKEAKKYLKEIANTKNAKPVVQSVKPVTPSNAKQAPAKQAPAQPGKVRWVKNLLTGKMEKVINYPPTSIA